MRPRQCRQRMHQSRCQPAWSRCQEAHAHRVDWEEMEEAEAVVGLAAAVEMGLAAAVGVAAAVGSGLEAAAGLG